MSKKQGVIVFSLALVAGLILVVNGAVLYYYLNANQTEIAAAPTTPAPTSTPTHTPTPYPTIALPNQENTAVPTPLPTKVVTAIAESREKNSLIEDLGEYMADHAPPTRTPGAAPAPVAPSAGNASIAFHANPTSITAGSCSTLSWRVEGVNAYWVDGEPGAGGTGSRSVCPGSTQTFELKYQTVTTNNMLKTYYQSVTVYVNESSSSSSSSSSSGSSSSDFGLAADAAYKASMCDLFSRDRDRAISDGDVVEAMKARQEMELWQCNGDPYYIPSECDQLALEELWARAEGDVFRIMDIREEMELAGCQ